jgi:tetratricopeptide (TPR) repeat protein
MKLLTVFVLSVLATLPLMAEDQTPVPVWSPIALKAQQQLRESRFAEAAETANQALQIAKHFGTDIRLASNYHLLGVIYRDWGHCSEARNNYLHAIALWRKLPDSNSRYLFRSMTSLISVMVECDDFPAAEKTFRAYAPQIERSSTDPRDQANLVSLRAVMARAKRNYPQAEALYHESIAMLEKLPNSKPEEIAIQWSSLAVVLDKEGRHAESLEQSERAIAFFERAAPRHPSFVASLNNAGCSLADMGRKDEAEQMFERALAGAQALYGDESRVTAKIMLSYARTLRENKQAPAAADWQKKGTEAFRRSLVRDSGTVDAEELKMLGK